MGANKDGVIRPLRSINLEELSAQVNGTLQQLISGVRLSQISQGGLPGPVR